MTCFRCLVVPCLAVGMMAACVSAKDAEDLIVLPEEADRPPSEQMLRRPGGDREVVDILALVLHHDEEAVLVAVEMALAEGVATKTHVLNILHRLIDKKTTGGPHIDTPQSLSLHAEPEANVERYDDLRVLSAGGHHAS